MNKEMLIASWNINGIRSAEQKLLDFIDGFKPDFLLLQEVRASINDLSLFLRYIPQYRLEFNYSGHPGYGGTALYYKENAPLEKVSCSTGEGILDNEGRSMIVQLGDLNILNFYVPNGSRGGERLSYKIDFYKSIIRYAKDLVDKRCSVVIGGDLNVAHTEKDLYCPAANKNHSGFLPVERELFNEILGIGFLDSFRIFSSDGGCYTWWHMRDPKRERNNGWRFDYFLVSRQLEGRVRRSTILKDVFGSDHCPILLELER